MFFSTQHFAEQDIFAFVYSLHNLGLVDIFIGTHVRIAAPHPEPVFVVDAGRVEAATADFLDL